MAKETAKETVKETVKLEPKTLIKMVACYNAKDQEGAKVLMEYKAEGHTVEDLLASEGLNDFPVGINCSVILKVEKGDKYLERNVAPHKARLMIGGKNVDMFKNVFRGL